MWAVTDITGLRERRRRATTAEIEAAAFDLFDRFGSEHTTVDEIAAAAGVSPRTFFRYFPTKEDAVFGAKRTFFTAVSTRLAADLPGPVTLDTLTRATADVVAAHRTDATLMHRLMRLRCLCRKDDHLHRASLLLDAEQCRVRQDEIADAGDPRSALRARILIATVGVAVSAALDEWASRCAAGEDVDLVDVLRVTCALQRDLLDEH